MSASFQHRQFLKENPAALAAVEALQKRQQESVAMEAADPSAGPAPLAGEAARRWPAPPAPQAYFGLAGDIVRAIEPHSEADPVALLAQVLVAFGNVVGRNAHFTAEADRHGAHLFAVLVGVTSKGRKGTSWAHVRKLFEAVAPEWAQNRVLGGLSSGEGVIWAVRDAIEKHEAIREHKRVVDYQTVIDDPGISDKRLLVVEPELASPLRVMAREGSTLSPLLRQAWDTGDLRILTKNCPAKATGAHISLISHITRDELLRFLTSTETTNGFANRFLWLCVQRSKMLPEGGQVQQVDLGPLIARLIEAVNYASHAGELRRDVAARELWLEVYPRISEGKPGLLGSVTSRAEAQVMRLALVYALMDRARFIRRDHLQAALALWEFAEASARFIFGDALGHPVADLILTALRANPLGLTRSEIHALFDRHRSSQEIHLALTELAEHGLARCLDDESGLRRVEKWFALGAKSANSAPAQADVKPKLTAKSAN